MRPYFPGAVPKNVTPVLKVRGRYRDFAILETPMLGALTRGSRVATNVYEVLKAARGKQVLFFPARFDAHEVQAADGYAYQIAVQLFNQSFGKSLSAVVSTDAQGEAVKESPVTIPDLFTSLLHATGLENKVFHSNGRPITLADKAGRVVPELFSA